MLEALESCEEPSVLVGGSGVTGSFVEPGFMYSLIVFEYLLNHKMFGRTLLSYISLNFVANLGGIEESSFNKNNWNQKFFC